MMRVDIRELVLASMLFGSFLCGPARADGGYALLLLDVPDGLTVPPAVQVDLMQVATALGVDTIASGSPPCFLERPDGTLTHVISQFDPDPDCDWATNATGTLCLCLPRGVKGAVRVRVYLTSDHPPTGDTSPLPSYGVSETDGKIVISNRHFQVTHDPRKQAGMPCPIEFRPSGKVIKDFNWNDRVFKRSMGSVYLRQDPEPEVELVSSGPVRTVVRLRLAYTQGATRPESRPRAVYEFTYYPDLPFIGLRGHITQEREFHWPELKCVEIHFPARDFTRYATDATGTAVDLVADKKAHTGQWAALVDGDNVLGVVTAAARVYDGHGGYGTYLHGPWVQWSDLEKRFSAHVYASAQPGALDDLRTGASAIGRRVTCRTTTPGLLAALDDLNAAIDEVAAGEAQSRYRWAAALVERAGHDGGRLVRAQAAVEALQPGLAAGQDDPMDVAQRALEGGNAVSVSNGHLGLAFLRGPDGTMRLSSLFDVAAGRECLSANIPPLFTVELSDETGARASVSSHDSWQRVTIDQSAPIDRQTQGCSIRWESPVDRRLQGLSVTVTSRLIGPRIEWSIDVENPPTGWGVRRTDFPCIRIRKLDRGDDYALVPLGSGTATRHPIQEWKGYSSGYRSGEGFTGRYPSAWCSMQFGGYYDDAGGIYFAAHDPLASTKDLRFTPDARGLYCEFSWPAPNAGVPGSGFKQPGPCVTELFRGDWFDAAQVYRNWARAEAQWWPRGDLAGRPDIPKWMRDTVMWAHEMGDADNVVEPAIKLSKYLGVPTAVHWYSWHRIIFDNDYPHFFPARPSFAEGVRTLQENGVRVMPYINGRLWDSDTPDFPTVALPAAAKDENGDHYVEQYGSGQELVPMCPATKLWQDKVQEIALRLTGPEFNVDGVYIDQVSATEPCLCFDKTHGHPVGGGHWWTEGGYWPMLQSLQDRLPANKMITSECNADAYCRWLDGFLSWHFQCPDQVPLFAAVYGGTVQVFGRAYKGDDPVAHRMKTAQALVYGEQLGWLSARAVLSDMDVLAPFFRRVARLRHALLPYLSRGEMARPPVIEGEIPAVTADWAWHHYWPVTDSVLQRGAWKAGDGSLALIFVNVADQPISGRLVFDGAQYGFNEETILSVSQRTEDGVGEAIQRPAAFEFDLTLPAYGAVAYEIAAQ